MRSLNIEDIKHVRENKGIVEGYGFSKDEVMAIRLLSDNKYEENYLCELCGLKYSDRPFICLCKSNVFLRPIKHYS